jgi:hypothetical protein
MSASQTNLHRAQHTAMAIANENQTAAMGRKVRPAGRLTCLGVGLESIMV